MSIGLGTDSGPADFEACSTARRRGRHDNGEPTGLAQHDRTAARPDPRRADANTLDAKSFIERAEQQGVSAAVGGRDGPFGYRSRANPEDKPDPSNAIEP